MTKTARLLALSLVVAFVASNPLNSQQTLPSSLTNGFTPPGLEPGTPAHSYALSGFDNISYFSGKLNFRLPLLKIGGRGEAGYTMMLPIEREWSANAVPYFPPGGTVGCCQPTGYTFSPTPDFGYNIAKYGFFTPGSLYGRVTTSHGTASCQLPTVGQQTVTTAALTRFTFYEPDGTQHELRDAATGGASEPNPNQCNPPQQGYNRGRVFISYDESALRFVADQNVYDTYADGSGSTSLFQVSFPLVVYATGTLYFPDGRSYTIDTLGRVTKIHDRNGNLVTIEYQTDGATPPLPTGIKITDPLGRVIQVTYGSFSSNTAQTIISYPAYNSNIPRQIIVNSAMLGSALRNNYTSQPTVTCEDGSTSPHGIQTFEGLFPDSFADLSQCYNPIVVSSVVLANNQSYQMHYNPYGELARVDLPTGGAFEYDFVSAVPASTGGVMQFNGTAAVGVESTSNPYMAYRRVLTRRVYRDANTLESTTTIPTHAYNPTGDTTVTVTTADSGGNPVSAQTHYFFAQSTTSFNTAYTYGSTGIYYPSWQEGKEFKTEELKTADNSVLRSAVHTFKNGAEAAVDPPLAIDQGFNPHLVQTDTTLDTGQVSRSTFGYDAYSNRIDQSDYDLGSSSPGPLLRQIHHDFVTDPGYVPAAASVSGPYLPALPLHVKTYLGSTTYSEVDYEYDNYTPDGPANHAALSGSSYGTVPQWDSANYPSSVTARGNVTGVSQQVASGGATVNTFQQFDVLGNLVKTIDSNGNPTSAEYNSTYSYGLQTKVTSALNHDFTTTYDLNVGKPTGFTDVANNVTTTYDYTDSLDRLKQVVRASNVAAVKSQTSYSYNDSTRIVTTTSDQSTYGDNALTSEVEYDGLGRVNHTRHYEGSVCKIAVDMTYDAMGRAATVSNPYQQVTNSDEHCTLETPVSTATVYDSLGRVYSVTAPGGAVTSYGYSGNQTTVTDPAGKARTTAVDALGRLTNVAEDPTGLNYQTAYTFDPIDDLVKVAQGTPATSGTGSVTACGTTFATGAAWQTRVFQYDGLKRLTCAYNPESGPTNYYYTQASGSLCSGDSGSLCRKTNANAFTTTTSYDALNRITGKSYDDGQTPAVTFCYDGNASGACAGAPTGSYLNGRLTMVKNANSTSMLSAYDAVGRVVTGSQGTGAAYGFSYEYNRAGGLTALHYPSGRIVNYAFDGAGRVSQVLNYTLVTNNVGIGYASHGAINSLPLSNGVTEVTTFNSRLQPTQISAGSLLTLGFTYDTSSTSCAQDSPQNNGDVKTQTTTVGSWSTSQTYCYDGVNRLLKAFEKQGSTQTWLRPFNYDPYGNMWVTSAASTDGQTVNGITPTAQTFFRDLQNNNLTTNRVVGLTYDAAGNQRSTGDGKTFSYDAENRLVQITGTTQGTVNFAYDGDGRRVMKLVCANATPCTVATAGVLQTVYVHDAMGNLAAEYTTGPSSVPATATTFLTTDSLGSTRLTTDIHGNIVSRHDYLPFGEEITDSSVGSRYSVTGYGMADNVTEKFTGKERDAETGLDYFGARYLSSAQGRWMSPDWSSQPEALPYADLSDPQTLNLYGYVRNNPLGSADADGHGWRDFLAGTVNAVVTNSVGGLGRQQIDNRSFRVGQRVGDAISAVGGAIEMVAGATAAAGGGAEAVVTAPAGLTGAGVVIPAAGVAVAAGGVAIAGHGAVLAGTAIKNLMSDGSAMAPKPGESGGPGAGKSIADKTKGQALDENKSANGGQAKCVFCGEPVGQGTNNNINYDHAQAKANGGTNGLNNTNVACEYCNKSKGTGTAPKNPKQPEN